MTDNMDRRFQEHLAGNGGFYTRYNRPVEFLYSETFESRILAEKRERQIKRWSRAKKLALITGDIAALIGLSKSRNS